MTAKKNPADLKPRSVPTTSEERNSYRAMLTAWGVKVPASVNGATLRTMYEKAKGIRAEFMAIEHEEALRIDAAIEQARVTAAEMAAEDAVRVPALIAEGNAEIQARKKAVQIEAARKAVETRRRNQAARELAAKGGQPGETERTWHVGAVANR